MPHIDMQELLIILAVVLLVFGGRKLPEIGKALGERMRAQRLDPFGAEPPIPDRLEEKLLRLGGLDDERFIQQVAVLCHPNKLYRELATMELIKAHVQDGLPTGTLLREVREVQTLRSILATRQVGLERAAWRWATMLKSGPSPYRAAAAHAVAVAEFELAVPALLEALGEAPPEVYLAALHALARLRARAAAPVFAAFAVNLPQGSPPPGGDLPAGVPMGRFPLKPLLRAYSHHYHQCNSSQPDALPSGFARDALWELGEAELLYAARDLSDGNGDRAVALKDPRLFEALVVALARCPRAPEARPMALAAIRGLVALGDTRSVSLLEWISRPWRVFWVDNVIWDSARAAERHVRGRRGSHVVPSAAPGGSGSEVAGSEAPPERRAP